MKAEGWGAANEISEKSARMQKLPKDFPAGEQK